MKFDGIERNRFLNYVIKFHYENILMLKLVVCKYMIELLLTKPISEIS